MQSSNRRARSLELAWLYASYDRHAGTGAHIDERSDEVTYEAKQRSLFR